ncbi:MAG: hypothetical protein LM579_04515 [Thermodesulfobacterium sp.]|nr:hypothetical protein [Thermodesulfobacterium sp.]
MSKAVLEIYEALKLAGVPEDKAKASAKAVAEISQEDRLSRIENELIEIKGEIKLIKWMLGLIIAGILSLILKTYF